MSEKVLDTLVSSIEAVLSINERLRRERPKIYKYLVSGKEDHLLAVADDFNLREKVRSLRVLLVEQP